MKKTIIYLVTIIIIAILIFPIWKNYNINQKQVAVLVYHDRIEKEEMKGNDKDALTIQEFEEQLKYLKK